MAETNSTGKLGGLEEGFLVTWDARGLHIEVVDYHASLLSLNWETLLDLLRRARPDLLPPEPARPGD